MPPPRLLRRLVRTSRALAGGLTAILGALVIASACGPSSSAIGPGGECFLAVDCAPGLICVEQPDKTRVCSDDLSRVAGREPGDDEDESDAASEGGPDGAAPDRVSPPVKDSGPPDTGPPDTGPPPTDAAGE